jgi:hypothetical protein
MEAFAILVTPSNYSAQLALTNDSTDGGKVKLSSLLAAFAQGQHVTIRGTGNCAVYGDTELTSHFYTDD